MRWFAFAFGCLAISLPLLPFVEHLRGNRALKTIDKLHRKEGRSWTVQKKFTDTAATNAFFDLSNAVFTLPGSLRGYSFRPALMAPGQMQRLVESEQFLQRSWDTPQTHRATYTTNTWATLEWALSTNRAKLDFLAGALIHPRYAVPESSSTDPALVHEVVSRLRSVAAWWLQADALVAMRRGEHQRALEDIRNLIRAAELLSLQYTEPVQGPRREILRQGVWLSWELLNCPDVSDSTLSALQKSWEIVDCIQSLPDECKREFCRMRQFLRDLKSPDSEARLALHRGFRDPPREDWSDALIGEYVLPHVISGWAYLFADHTEAHFARRAAELLDATNESIPKHNYRPWRNVYEAGERERREAGLYSDFRIGGSFFLLPGERIESVLRTQTEISMIRSAIALKRFHLARGYCPEDLKTLQPDFMIQEPRDWFSGQNLKYHRNSGANWTLYSVGTDGVDNRCVALQNKNLRPYSIWSVNDAIWPEVASEEAIKKWQAKQ